MQHEKWKARFQRLKIPLFGVPANETNSEIVQGATDLKIKMRVYLGSLSSGLPNTGLLVRTHRNI
ncbi:hypothetical protein AQ436_10385 [Arthrobacter sp. EpRS66]|nr:hypothetical protein AQ436_10385 [Arthrobacter sp. EpRS66]